MRKLVLVACLLAIASAVGVARTGTWFDEIVFFQEDDQPKVLSMMQTGEAHFFGNTFEPVNQATIESLGLPYEISYGNFNEILLNPEGPFFEDGRLNPFHDEEIQQALNRLIDRDFLVDELLYGLGLAQYTVMQPVEPTYAQIADVARQTEIKFAYNEALAIQQINDRMVALGCELVNGTWHYNGDEIVIIGILRVEDERQEMGEYFGAQLEKAGFKVDLQYKRSAEASPIWNRSPGSLGTWHYYTGGWIASAIDREAGWPFCGHYTDVCYPTARTVGYPDEVDQQMYDYAIRIANGEFTSTEERIELFRYCEEQASVHAFHLWVYTSAGSWVIPEGLGVTVDLMAGIFGGRLWPRTMRYTDDDGAPIVGGTIRVANPSFLTDPWNAPAGSNWLYDALIQRGLEDVPVMSDPFTGLGVLNFLEKADVTVQEGLPVFQSQDWCSLTFVPEIAVPADAWSDWDAAAGEFITAGTKFPDGATSLVKIRFTYPSELWTWKWHDGSTISMGDMLMGFIYGFPLDPAKPESPYYDASAVSTYDAGISTFKGLKIISVDPLVFDVYVDGINLDAETIVINNDEVFWFTYLQGTAPWHTMALGLMSEAAGLGAFSNPKATELGVDWLNYAAGPTLQQMTTNLGTAQVENFLPYPNVFGDYVTQQEITTRYANLANFVSTYGHMYVGTGPMYVESFDPLASIVVCKRFADYPLDLAQFLVFAEPKIAELAVSGPDSVAIGSEATFDVAITYEGEAYPADEVVMVSYIVIDAQGAIAFNGDGVVVGDGQATITLPAAETANLVAGSSRLEVICTVVPVALMSTTQTTFIAQ